MGWDAFGLPAENAGHGARRRPQGLDLREHRPHAGRAEGAGPVDRLVPRIRHLRRGYYGKQQAWFLDLFDAGLVYRKESVVNWDPVDQTVLANEQVVDGRGWRSGALVEKRKLNQWAMRITDYADQLVDDLATLDRWPDKVRVMQENWIGRSQGLRCSFEFAGGGPAGSERSEVYTTRPVHPVRRRASSASLADHPLAEQLAAAIPDGRLQSPIAAGAASRRPRSRPPRRSLGHRPEGEASVRSDLGAAGLDRQLSS
jgi:leucyl-tRNA synthetase